MKKTLIISAIILGVLLAAAAVFFATQSATDSSTISETDEIIVTQPILEYGIPVDSFNVQSGTIREIKP